MTTPPIPPGPGAPPGGPGPMPMAASKPTLTKPEFDAIRWAELSDADFSSWMDGKQAKQLSVGQKNTARGLRPRNVQFNVSDMSGNDLGAAPFANQGMAVEEFGVRWWFQYFWQEAKMVATETDKIRMVAVCNRLFVKTPQGPLKYRCQDAFQNDEPQPVDPAPWLEMLTTLLEIGFRRVDPKEAVATGPQGPPVTQPAAHHLMQRAANAPFLEAMLTPVLARKQSTTAEIFWRSETRSMERIVDQQGTLRQVDVGAIAKEMHMDADWHPFSVPENKKYMWFRLGQRDNDYYTVISVATNFETALGFPKINEKRVYGFPKKLLKDWTADELKLHQKNLALVALPNGSTQMMLVTQTTAYMCVLCGRIIDTRSAGGGFPEKGVSEIPLDQIFAMLPITRVHFGPEPEHGFVAFPDFNRGRLVVEDFGKAMDLFGDVYQRCCDEYFTHKYGGKVVTAWTSSGPMPPKDPTLVVDVSSIREFPISQQSLQGFLNGR